MLVIDSSAIVAILMGEPDGPVVAERMKQDPERAMSVANYLETGTMLAARRQPSPAQAVVDMDAVTAEANIALEPVTEDQIRLAMKARIKFGKGFGVGGGLNFGDCFAYALAKSLKAPLLFVGDDFSKTDITPALATR